MKRTTHQLLAATLMISGSFCGIRSAIAQTTPTSAGTTISNTATATYSDGTTTYNATSNTVEVRVAEVPGINLTVQTPTNPTPNAGDTLTVNFVISNVGNDPTQFFIPGTATLSDSTNFSPNGQLEIVAVDGVPITPVLIPAGGANTSTLLGAAQGSIAVAPGGASTVGTVTVRVPIRVNATAPAGAATTVALGETATPNDQNVDRVVGANDVYTVDNPDGVSGEAAGVLLASDAREAMATSGAITVNARLQAFAAILKASGAANYSNNNTPGDLIDDTLIYRLALRVDNPTVTNGLAASDLHPTALTLDSLPEDRVLISDAIPAGTALSSAPLSIVAPDSTWVPVYTVSPTSISALQAAWVRVRPTTGTITRVGFVRSTAVTKGTTVTGFSFTVNPLSTFKGGQIANIAQVFGQSQPGAVVPGTSTQLVYDESGDQSANNQLKGGNPDPNSGGAPATGLGIGDGVANPTTDGTDGGTGSDPSDTANTNQGNTEDFDGGEDNIFVIAATPLNGPNGQPGAVNTTNNDDFTNLSIVPPANLNPATPLTDAQTPDVQFTNTVQNTSGTAQTISLLPTPPLVGTLPAGTVVTIAAGGGGGTATYTYNGTGFDFTSGTGGTSSTVPVRLVNIPANDPTGTTDRANYTVTVNLPNGVAQLTEFPVPVLAFVDQNNDGSPTNEPGNTTIDRLYTGYVRLVKEARILDETGTNVLVSYTTGSAALDSAARPGRIIEYRIQYSNISTAPATNPAPQPPAAGNQILPANSLVITENGSAAPNNWFASTKDSVSGTLPGSATDSISGTTNISGTASGGDIQIYINSVGTVNPQGSGEFTFRRKIN